MNKKGFTLVELLATITIIGIICIIIFPSVNNLIKNNEKTTAEQIGNMMISATKKYANDERLEGTGCLSVPAKKLIYFGYIETVDAGNLKCDVNESFVRIEFNSTKKEYSYHLRCRNKTDRITFDTNDKEVSYCDDFMANSKGKISVSKSFYAPDLGARGENIDDNGLDSIGNTVVTYNSNLIPIRYNNGNCEIISLCVDNYHRYCYIDNGVLGKTKFMEGVLHTVNPEALKHYDIYKENSRECSILHTENFGSVMQIEVGALMVGKIKNIHTTGRAFNKGDEKGYFEFGGSTIVLFIEKDKVDIDDDLIQNTLEGYETAVKMGERIGMRKNL